MRSNEFRSFRLQAGLLQAEVGKYLEVTRETINRWEAKDGGYWELPRVYAEAFARLINDKDAVAKIKANRTTRTRMTLQERLEKKVASLQKQLRDRDRDDRQNQTGTS